MRNTYTKHFVDKKLSIKQTKERESWKNLFNPKSHRIVHLTKTILNTVTNANEVFYMSSNALLPQMGSDLFQLGQHSTGWRNTYRPYVGICPPMSDHCDTCKEHEERSRCRQVINTLLQSGNATPGGFMLYPPGIPFPCYSGDCPYINKTLV